MGSRFQSWSIEARKASIMAEKSSQLFWPGLMARVDWSAVTEVLLRGGVRVMHRGAWGRGGGRGRGRAASTRGWPPFPPARSS
jgi:hypothetical protein